MDTGFAGKADLISGLFRRVNWKRDCVREVVCWEMGRGARAEAGRIGKCFDDAGGEPECRAAGGNAILDE